MLGIHYAKVSPTTFVMQVTNGRVVREGRGLAFFYFAPRSTIVAVPVASRDVPFAFEETTADFQRITVQGTLTYHIPEPRRLAEVLDYSWKGTAYATDDPSRLDARVAVAAQTAARAQIQARPLRQCLVQADAVATAVRQELAESPAISGLGLQVLGFSLLSVRPDPDTARALEAEARELLLREADDALYGRRNNAVEQERRIRESELDTEVKVEAKRRQIEETKLLGEIAREEKRSELVEASARNTRVGADAKAYAAEASLKPWRDLDPKALQSLMLSQLEPRSMVALAFQEIAANASKVGHLNITPDLLDSLMAREPKEARTGRR